jgi:hypothetical protein
LTSDPRDSGGAAKLSFSAIGDVRHFSKITGSARQVLFFFAPVGMRFTPGISPASHIL